MYQTPPEPIFVRVKHRDGNWYDGFLEHWRRDDDQWRAFVRYTVGVGSTHIGWFSTDDVRPHDDATGATPPDAG